MTSRKSLLSTILSEHLGPLRVRVQCRLVYHVLDAEGRQVFIAEEPEFVEDFVRWYNERPQT